MSEINHLKNNSILLYTKDKKFIFIFYFKSKILTSRKFEISFHVLPLITKKT